MTTASLTIKVDASQVDKGKKSLDDLAQSGAQAEGGTKKAATGINAMSSAAKVAAGVLGALGVSMGVGQIVRYADRWSDLNSKLVNATGSQAAADKAMQSLSQTARTTYSSLEATSDSFIRNSMTLRELGYTMQQQINLSDALNNSLVISGTKGQQAESVMNALSKAMAEGSLRGDNFNSVIANGGRTVQALADGLGVGTIELRKLAETGQLTTGRVIDALTSQMHRLRIEAEAMPATVEDGFTLLGNAMLQTVGRMDQATGASQAVSGVMISLADNLESVGVAVGIVGVGMAGQYVAGAVAAGTATTALTTAMTALRAVLVTMVGPAGVIALAGGAMYLLVQRQKESADAAWAQAQAFDDVRAKLGSLTVNELARAVQAEFEHTRSLERSRDQLDRASDGSAAFEEKIRKLNLQIDASRSNHALLVGQLQRVREGWKPVTEETKAATAATIAHTQATKSLVHMMDAAAAASYNTEAAYVALMGVQVETYTRTTRLTEAQRSANLTNQDAADSIATVVEGMAAQELASESLTRVTDMMRNDISSAFADMIMHGENAFDAIAKSFERMVYKMVADWAAAGIMNMVSGAFGAAGGHTSTLGSIFSGGAAKAATGGASGGMMAGIGGAAKTAGSAIASGASSLGAGALALASNPVTWAVLGAAAIASQLDKSTPSYNAGMFLGGSLGAPGEFPVAPFASGVAPVGFTRRAGESDAVQAIESFRAVDSAVMGLFNAAGVDFKVNGNQLQGLNEEGLGSGRFLGLAGQDGKPGTDMESQLTDYARGLVTQAYAQGKIGSGLYNDLVSSSDYMTMINKGNKLVYGIDGSHADGLNYVPFDGYRAMLHKGERVQTASEARMMDSKTTDLVGEMRLMYQQMAKVAAATQRTADLLRRVTRDGESLVTVAA